MIPNRENLMDLAAALAMVGAAILAYALLFPAKAHAQLAVTDPPVETATGDLDLVQLPNLIAQATLTATSVTTPGGGGQYQPNASYISGLDQALFSGVNSQNFSSEFPGWQALPPNSTDAVSIPLVATVLQTYGQAIALAQSQEQELEGEDFTNISTISSNTTALLTAQQANTAAVLANIQEQQYTRQLLATLITVEATRAGEELNEKARASATNAMAWNGGVAP